MSRPDDAAPDAPSAASLRPARMERLLSELGPAELRLTALRAIDAAHHAAAEVAEAKAVYEGALGEAARLGEENRALRERLDELEADMTVARRVWHSARRASGPLRRDRREG